MAKYMILMRGSAGQLYPEFKKQVMDLVQLFRAGKSVSAIRLTLTEQPPPTISIIPFKKQKAAVVSVYSTENPLTQKIREHAGICGIYRVDEATPVAYSKTWEDGMPSPGVCLLTFFRQKKGISYDTFIDRWHNSHTPLSLKIHPLWNYSRNVVIESNIAESEPWDGLVEEQVQNRSDLLNPFKFFGNPFIILYNMLRVYTDTRSFLEYKTIEPYLATEYVLLSTPQSTATG